MATNNSVQKLNDALGIQDIDEYLADLNIDEDKTQAQVDSIDENVKKQVQQIDQQIQNYQQGGLSNINLTDIESSLDEIKNLIETSKQVIRHVFESIQTSELVDPDVIQSLAALMESSHLSTKEYIDLYRDRMNFYDKVRLENIKFNQKKELLELKYKLDMQRDQAKNPVLEAQDVVAFSTGEVVENS